MHRAFINKQTLLKQSTPREQTFGILSSDGQVRQYPWYFSAHKLTFRSGWTEPRVHPRRTGTEEATRIAQQLEYPVNTNSLPGIINRDQ